MDKTKRKVPFLGQVLLVLLGIVILYMTIDLSRLVGVSYQRRKELHRLEEELAAAQARQSALREQLAYAQSEAAVEEWARENGLTRPGEVPVVILAPVADEVQVGRHPSPEGNAASIREMWWNLFFGP